MSLQGAAPGDKGQAGSPCVLCVPILAAPGAVGAGDNGDIPAQPCRAHSPSWLCSDTTEQRARPAHPPCFQRSSQRVSRILLSSQAAPRPPPFSRCVIPGSESEFIQLLARGSSAPSDVAAVARLTALGHAAPGR